MSIPAHVLIDQVLQRVRDPEGVTASRDFVRLMLGYAQQIVNAKLSLIVDNSSLTTEPLRCFYPIAQLVPQSQMVTFVRDSDGKDLLPVTWKSFWYMKRGWPREVAERMQVWSTVGRDLLVLWPARRVAETVAIVSARLIPLLASEQSRLEVHDHVAPIVVDLGVVLTLLKMRKGDLATESLASVTARMEAIA